MFHHKISNSWWLSAGTTSSRELSDWFISLPQFLFHFKKDLEWQTNYNSGRISWLSFLDLKQQTGDRSVTVQADRSFIEQTADSALSRHGSRPALKKGPLFLLNSLFILPISSSCFCSMQNRGLVPPIRKWNAIREGGVSGHIQNRVVTYSFRQAWTEFWLMAANYITDSIAHVFSIIQSAITRLCMYRIFMNP